MPRKNSSSWIGATTSAYSTAIATPIAGRSEGTCSGACAWCPETAESSTLRATPTPKTMTGYRRRPNPTEARISRHHVPAAGNPRTCRQVRWDVESQATSTPMATREATSDAARFATSSSSTSERIGSVASPPITIART